MQAFPFQSNFTGCDDQGNPLYDRAVGADFVRKERQLFYKNGIFANPSDNFQVFANGGMELKVKPGACFVQGATGIEIEDTILTLQPSAELVDRTDLIVIQLDDTHNRSLTVEVKSGTTELRRDSDVWELQLASVRVRKSVTTILQSDITDTRLSAELCGIVTGMVENVDTETLFNQYQAYWNQKTAEWDSKGDQQEVDWQSQMENQQAGYEHQHDTIQNWYDSVKVDIATLQTFNFDNLAELPGTNRETVFNVDGSITETIKKTSSNANVAKRETVFLANGNIQATITVFDDDGVGTLRQSTITTVFNPDGTISEEVISI